MSAGWAWCPPLGARPPDAECVIYTRVTSPPTG